MIASSLVLRRAMFGHVVVLVLVLVIAACGGKSPDPGKTPSGARASCSADSECVVETRSGCCELCPSAPFAIPLLSSEQRKNRCADASCAPAPAGLACPKVDPPDGYVAMCRDGSCAAVARK